MDHPRKLATLGLLTMLSLILFMHVLRSEAHSRALQATAEKSDAQAQPVANCIDCHRKNNPQLVLDWETSKHKAAGVDCTICHPRVKHTDAKGMTREINALPTPEVCKPCHEERVQQFLSGKHSLAWASMKAMPTTHALPLALREGMKGCGGCHKIGVKSQAEIAELKKDGAAGFGVASCDACHTRHTFSVLEARQPQACQTCHTGFDHPQWEMYSGSKHGVRYLLKQSHILPEHAPAPACQTCHMPGGDHGVQTAWGFLAVRLPMPEDQTWAADRAVILQALGVLNPEGKPAPRLDVVKSANVARLTAESWQKERDRMHQTCSQCHSAKFAKQELAKGDEMIREADHLMAEAIRTVASLYKQGKLRKPEAYADAFPDLLTFHDAPTPIETRLFEMFLEHRMRAFQGTFHANPDYALWYGWSELKRDLTDIQAMAEELKAR